MYEKLLETRWTEVDGESDWTWIKSDNGAWDGPSQDWIYSHKTKYFKHLKSRKIVVTAGANQGMYARFYSKLFETVYAFEPDPLNFHCLVMNTQTDNVIKIQGALGATNGFVSIKRTSMDNTGMHKVAGPGMIPMFAIDSFGFEHIDLLQLDVEGYEGEVLKGAIETIKRCKPVIVAERGHVPEVKGLLEPLGYKDVGMSISDNIFAP